MAVQEMDVSAVDERARKLKAQWKNGVDPNPDPVTECEELDLDDAPAESVVRHRKHRKLVELFSQKRRRQKVCS